MIRLSKPHMLENMMLNIPKDHKKIKAQIHRYERALKKELDEYGCYDDGAGKRYMIGPLYLILGDVAGAMKSYKWFKENFPDDSGLPIHFLCWALALYRSGDLKAAQKKLLQTMFSNLYLIPHLLGYDQGILDVEHSSNWESKEYLNFIPVEILELWNEEELKWAKKVYDDTNTQKLRDWYIAIEKLSIDERPGSVRSKLVEDASKMQNLDFEGS